MVQSFHLTAQQDKAFFEVTQFLSSPHKAFLLKGYAGTGKTTLLQYIIAHISSCKSIAITAPTNKAVKVLRSKIDKRTNVSFSTIHKLLRVTKDFDIDGNPIFIPDPYIELTQEIVIIDEASMLDSNMFRMLLLFRKKFNFKIIFVGDECQINPVNEKISPVFRFERFFKNSVLQEIVRQADGNSIIPLSKSIRDYIDTDIITLRQFHNKSDDNIEILRLSDTRLTRSLIDQYYLSSDYSDNPSFVKVLGWTNNLINKTNDRIREILYGTNCDYIEINETLIANSPVIGKRGDYTYYISTNDEFKIIDYAITSKIYYPKAPWGCSLHYYKCTIEHSYFTDITIKILHPDSQDAYNKIAKELREIAKFKKKSPEFSLAQVKAAWREADDFKNEFADFKYNHALTVHKSQGSTYENVFIYEYDILRNPNIIECNRILYTAVTRASQKIFIIS